MKKFLLIAVLALSTALVSAQALTPRFGVATGSDNTGRNLTYNSLSPTLSDVDSVSPNASVTYYKFTAITHAKTLTANIKRARKWDEVVLEFTCDTLTAGRVVTFSTGFHTANSGGTFTVKASKKMILTFYFDGVAYIQKTSMIEY